MVAAALRDGLAARTSARWTIVAGVSYLAFAWVNMAVTASRWLDGAPAVATTAMTATLLLRDRPFAFRCVSLAGVWLWWAYFAAVGSFPGHVQSALLTGSIVLAICRHDRAETAQRAGKRSDRTNDTA